MLGILVDAAVLVVLLKVFTDEDPGFGTAFLLAFGAAIGTAFLVIGLGVVMGVVGLLLGAIVSAGVLGVAISALFGAEIKRSFLIAGIFMFVHLGFSALLHVVLGP